MAYKLMQHNTRVSCYLSLTIVTRQNASYQRVTIPLLAITAFLFYFVAIRETVLRNWFEVVTLCNDLQSSFDFTLKVFAIGIKSLTYGLGVTI